MVLKNISPGCGVRASLMLFLLFAFFIVHYTPGLEIGKHKGIKFHFCADDPQLYVHLSLKNAYLPINSGFIRLRL